MDERRDVRERKRQKVAGVDSAQELGGELFHDGYHFAHFRHHGEVHRSPRIRRGIIRA